jgi:Dolichyl-phosphate-mannose-protein mannosyltransferase
VNRGLERLALLAFASALVATLALRANAKPFWHDEIYTIVCARLPSIGALWRAHREGLDLSPPLNSLLTMAVFRLGGTGRVTTRLPALAGFLCAEWAVFEIVRKRSTALSGFTAALLLCFTAALRYAYEARGYGLMLGAFAVALYAWSEAARGIRRRLHVPLLALALAAGCWAQYFGVLAFVPIAAGEAVRSLKRRTIDRPVWIAAAIAAVAVLPLVPLVRAGSAQAATFWAHASAADVGAIYRFLLQPLMYPLVEYAAAAIAIALTFGLLRRGRGAPVPLAPPHEVVAACFCVLLPAIGLVAAISSTGVFVPRYGLNGAVGFAIAAPLLISYLSNGAGLAPLVLPSVLSIGFAQGVVETVRHAGDPFADPFEQRPALAAAARLPRPVVITGGLMYLQLWYYAPPALRTHLWYIADPAQSMRYTGTDTIDQGYRVLRDRVALNAPDYATFVAQHHDFVLYGAGSGWLTARLAEDGAKMEPAGTELGAPIVDVTVK